MIEKENLVGPTNKILEVDLTKRKASIYVVTDKERKLYLGGKGLGLKLIFDRMPAGVDPMGEENILALMPGVVMGTGAPCSGRFHAVTKSPLTGIMTSSSCGGAFGMQLKTAGWDGVLIKGKADRPVYIEISAKNVSFKDADEFWGMDTVSVQEKIIEHKRTAALVIGPAGEKGVRFASIASGHRFLGRGGMGAVMGAKNLKAIVAAGGGFRIKPVDADGFEKVRKKAVKYISSNKMTSDVYTNYGTRANVNMSNKGNILPINNFSDGSSDEAEKYPAKRSAKSTRHFIRPVSLV